MRSNCIHKYDTYVINIVNSILEMVWSQVKGFMAKNNKTFKLKDFKILVDSPNNQVTAQEIKICIEDVV